MRFIICLPDCEIKISACWRANGILDMFKFNDFNIAGVVYLKFNQVFTNT